MGAEYIWRWTPTLTYPDWRHPLYPYLLGLGAVDTYAQSARGWNALGALLGMGAFAWVGHRSRHPWLGVLGMAMWMFHPLVEDARDWINPYLLWGGVIGSWMASSWTLGETLRKSESTIALWLSGLCTGLLGVCALLLDGRSVWLAVLVLAFLFGQRFLKTGMSLMVFWLAVMGLERAVLARYNIEVHGLWTQLELQRTYLFRDNMALQLFPPPTQVSSIVDSCRGISSTLWPISWDCGLEMGGGNIETWSVWGLLPPWYLCPLLLIPFLGQANRQWKIPLFILIAIAVPLLLSGLVWQPPRYLFWTVWLWLAGLLLGVKSMVEIVDRRLWIQGVSLIVSSAVGWWLWTAPALNSMDKPKDWPTTGRLVAEQVGDVVLDCTGRGYTMSQLSSHRSMDWSLVIADDTCLDAIRKSDSQGWGGDTVLSERRFSPPVGWTLETGFDFKSGVVWMYRRETSQ